MQHDLRRTVVEAVKQAFGVDAEQVRENLAVEKDGHVYGVVVVQGAAQFDNDSIAIRSRKFWKCLRELAGQDATNVGVVLLRSAAEAAKEGF